MEQVNLNSKGIEFTFTGGVSSALDWSEVQCIDAYAVDTMTTEYLLVSLNHVNGDMIEFDETTNGFWEFLEALPAYLTVGKDLQNRVSAIQLSDAAVRLFTLEPDPTSRL